MTKGQGQREKGKGKSCPFLCALLLVAAVAARPDAQSAAPRRIVSLVPAVTEMLFAVGAGPDVVAVSSYDREPPEVERLPRVGALLDPDLERILSLKPDLVVVYATQDELRSQLTRAGVPMFPYAHGGLAGITASIRAVGERTGHASAAATVVARIAADLEAVRRRVAGRPPPRVLLVFGRDPQALRSIYVSGGTGFLHDVVELAGGVNVLAEVGREGLQISAEQILAKRPDVILELRADAAATDEAETIATWRSLPALPAVRNRRVHLLRGSELVVPGPRIARGAERIAKALHPEAW